MFVQVIEGRVSDADRLRAQFDKWERELGPSATGWLGSTGGIAADGRFIMFARFDSEQAAQANSDRSEQGAWFAETEQCFDGPVSFTNSTDVEPFLAGGSDDAGFVQVMKISDVDRQKLSQMDAAFEPHASTWRPDLLGGTRVWAGPNSCYEVNYFTSEAEARANESKPPPPEAAQAFEEFGDLMSGAEFIDLPDPILASPGR